MPLRWMIWSGILVTGVAAIGGCGVQDSDQPAMGSISVPGVKDDKTPSLGPVRSEKTPASRN